MASTVGRRAWRAAALGLSVALLVPGPCCFSVRGETPVDSLRVSAPGVGQLMWRTGVEYSASGRDGLGIDELGPYAYSLLTQNWTLSVSAVIGLGGSASIGASAALQRFGTAERRVYVDLDASSATAGRGASCCVWQQFRLDAASELDPRLTISAGYPVSAGFVLSGSIVRDPIVLTAEVGFQGFRTLPARWLVLSVGAGFVANTRIQLTSIAGIEVPVDAAAAPAGRLGCEIRYSLDSAGREVTVRAVLAVKGERVSLLIGVELSAS